jgi:hypothetical protein
VGTTPPLPLPRLRRPRPIRPRLPLHQRAIICMWYSPVSVPVTAYTPSRRCNYGGMSVRRCWSPGDTWRPRSCPEPGGGYHSTDMWRLQSCPASGGGSRSRGDTCRPRSYPEPTVAETRGAPELPYTGRWEPEPRGHVAPPELSCTGRRVLEPRKHMAPSELP